MLLKKLFHYLPMTESQALQSTAALKSLAASFQGNLPPTVLGPMPPSEHNPTQSSKKKKGSKNISPKKRKESMVRQGETALITSSQNHIRHFLKIRHLMSDRDNL